MNFWNILRLLTWLSREIYCRLNVQLVENTERPLGFKADKELDDICSEIDDLITKLHIQRMEPTEEDKVQEIQWEKRFVEIKNEYGERLKKYLKPYEFFPSAYPFSHINRKRNRTLSWLGWK